MIFAKSGRFGGSGVSEGVKKFALFERFFLLADLVKGFLEMMLFYSEKVEKWNFQVRRGRGPSRGGKILGFTIGCVLT